jgi:transposase
LNLPDNIEELKFLILKLFEENKTLKEENQQLKQRVQELEMQINSNSHNSSKPPSTDGFKKKTVLPKIKHDKKGGQKGHKGNTLKKIENPDIITKIPLTTCPDCGGDLSQIQKVVSDARQVFDLPEPKLFVTEYRNEKCLCPNCQTVKFSSFPEFVNAPVQYGNGVKSFAVLLNVVYKIPLKKIRMLFSDLYKYPINEATIISASEICYQNLETTEKNIAQQILNSPTVHFDETGFRVNGKNNWLHAVTTSMFTYLFVHLNRGKKALESAKSLIGQFTGWAVHDCWSSYFNFSNVKHAICGAHLLRELQGLLENGSRWAKEFQAFLLEIYQFRKEKPNKTLPEWTIRYDKICEIANQEEPPPIITGKRGKYKRTKGRNLLERLKNYKDAVLAFSIYDQVPFTNNQAERDIRPTKLKQKVSGCFRTFHGAEIYARIEGYVSTLRKNGFNIFKELSDVFMAKNYNFEFST